MRVRTIALRALLISISIGSLLGIFAILGSRLGETGFKILATSFTISGASALVLASLAAWKLPAARVPSRVGVFASLVALVLVNAGMWMEFGKDDFWRVAFTFVVAGAAGAHASLLSLVRLAPRHAWMRPVAITNLVFLAAGLCAVVWAHHATDGMWKLVAILAILDVAFTLATAALDFVNRASVPEGGVAEVCFCPRCGRRLWQPAGEVRCGSCNAAFFIEMRPSEDLPTAVAQKT
jgi:hypothetical protein